MSFTILTCISPDFINMSSMFLPSWYLWSGAESVKVRLIDGGMWFRNIAIRVEAIREEVLSASSTGGKVVCLDVDLFVLRDLSGGFSDRHPVSVARWPYINAGVMFFNTAVPFPWVKFFDEFDRRIRESHRQYEAKWEGQSFPKIRKQHVGDQKIWEGLLHENEDAVCKLDVNEWNFCEGGYFTQRLPQHRDTVRIVHVKAHGHPRAKRIQLVKELFPSKVRYLGR